MAPHAKPAVGGGGQREKSIRADGYYARLAKRQTAGKRRAEASIRDVSVLDLAAKCRGVAPPDWLPLAEHAIRTLLAPGIAIDVAIATCFRILLEHIEAYPHDRDIVWARHGVLEQAMLARAGPAFPITEMQSANGCFVGKIIKPDGSIQQYPKITWWKQRVARIPATIACVFEYLLEAREHNICLIRGAPANLTRQPTRRWKAYIEHRGKDRGDHGFIDTPSRLLFLDIDGVEGAWMADPEGAVMRIVAQLGGPWSNTSVCWFFSATHGLERDADKRWTGRLVDGAIRVHLAFLTDRALNEAEAKVLTDTARACIAQIDPAISRLVQPNYITRPKWEAGEGDVLGDIPSIGYVQGAEDYLLVPDKLEQKTRWAQAQGQHSEIADHPDAETAVRSIGSDGSVRAHLKAAVEHLLGANPIAADQHKHAVSIVGKLRALLNAHKQEIINNLKAWKRNWCDVEQYLPENMIDWAVWVLEHPKTGKRIRLIEASQPNDTRDEPEVLQRARLTITEVIQAAVQSCIKERKTRRQ
jgi:hypothetical protein